MNSLSRGFVLGGKGNSQFMLKLWYLLPSLQVVGTGASYNLLFPVYPKHSYHIKENKEEFITESDMSDHIEH